MNRLRLIVQSLFFFWRVNLAVGLGVAAATAVLTGALLVGDSMRGSLREISLDGLGKIDEILIADRFFREELANELENSEEFKDNFEKAESVVLFPNASASFTNIEEETKVANKVTLIGCKNGFWDFGLETIRPKDSTGKLPEFDELDLSALTTPIVINQPLAADLGISVGDLESKDGVVLTVQIPKPQLVNADNPIGKKKDLYEIIARLKIVDIVPAKSLGRFTLHPTQLIPRILFLPMSTVQEALEKEDLANAIVVAANSENRGTSKTESKHLQNLLKPKIADTGLIFKKVELSYKDEKGGDTPIFSYTSLSCDSLLLNEKTSDLAQSAFNDLSPQPVLTYLANSIELNESEAIPFSMVTAIDQTKQFELTSAVDGEPISKLEPNQIAISSWAADDFLLTAGQLKGDIDEAAKVRLYQGLIGRDIVVSFYEPEASHGKLVPRNVTFELSDIVKVETPNKPFSLRGRRSRPAEFNAAPTLANDPDLTPFVPGVTDQASINKWDLPFKTETRGQDDTYWDYFRTTPKAFISLKKGQELWQSRFGKVTSLRIYGDLKTEELEQRLMEEAEKVEESFGLDFIPIKRRNLQASSGTTPFDGLFLGLSFFIIISALILIALLFRLGVEQKSSQLGLLAAVGLNRIQISRLLLLEGLFVSVLGAAIGIGLGVGYAKLMVYGLTTWWVDAVMTSFMQFHWTYRSLAIGFMIGVFVSLATIWVTILRMGRMPIRELLSGKTEPQVSVQFKPSKLLNYVSLGSFLFAVCLAILAAFSLGGEAQAGAFMGGGFLMLTFFLIRIWIWLKRPSDNSQNFSRMLLAFQNASRNPLRSTMTIGLVAAATFLIVAISSFRLAPTEEGTGGFDLIAESSRPIVGDFQVKETRDELLDSDLAELKDIDIYSFRYLPGDEAGCNNPFQAQRPKVLGVTDSFIELFEESEEVGFAWGGTSAKTEPEKQNPWKLLKSETDDDTIPVIIDKNTAMYSLKVFGVGSVYESEFEDGRTIRFKVVGLLSNSILQGSLIIDEDRFEELFPTVTGYRVFLINDNDLAADISDDAISELESKLSVYGFDASSSVTVLNGYLAVQNTYLSTFQTLGAFGLLLGTFGLATVQIRNVVERRRELALMQAVGFSKGSLGGLVLSEHAFLLLAGMAIGFLSALFSVVPHMVVGQAQVPLVLLGSILTIILVVGFVAGFGAIISSLRTPILAVLRSEN